MQIQKKDGVANQGTFIIQSARLKKVMKTGNVQKSQKMMEKTTRNLSCDVQDAMKHLDDVVSKMRKITDDNDQLNQCMTSQLRSLPLAWSVRLRTKIQNTISKVVLDSLSSSKHETSNVVHPFPYFRPSSQESWSYSSGSSSHESGPSASQTCISQQSATVYYLTSSAAL